MPNSLTVYSKAIESELLAGNATEHIHRPALKTLIEALPAGVNAGRGAGGRRGGKAMGPRPRQAGGDHAEFEGVGEKGLDLQNHERRRKPRKHTRPFVSFASFRAFYDPESFACFARQTVTYSRRIPTGKT